MDFDIELPLYAAKSAGIEPRMGGPTEIVLEFSTTVTLGTSHISLSSGTCGSVTQDTSQATCYHVSMSGASNNACLAVTLSNVVDSQGNSLQGTNQVSVVCLVEPEKGSKAIFAPSDVN